MRYLKSVLFIVLVSVFAVQLNATNVANTPLSEEVKAPLNIIEIVYEGRNVQVTNTINSVTYLTLTNASNEIIYINTLAPYGKVTLSNLSPGTYKLEADSVQGDTVVTIIIE